MNTPALQLNSASATYNGVAILRDVDLTVHVGECVALVGRSGAGKSTLLRTLYTHGNGDAALMPQELGLVRSLSVFHNVYMGGLHRTPTWYNLVNLARPFPAELGAVRKLLQRLGLEEKLFTATGELSGGQQQRTAVARALFHGGGVLLADEPVSAVDEPQAHRVLTAFRETFETFVLAMHDVKLALQYTDRIVGLRDGRIALDENTAALEPADLAGLYAD